MLYYFQFLITNEHFSTLEVCPSKNSYRKSSSKVKQANKQLLFGLHYENEFPFGLIHTYK